MFGFPAGDGAGAALFSNVFRSEAFFPDGLQHWKRDNVGKAAIFWHNAYAGELDIHAA